MNAAASPVRHLLAALLLVALGTGLGLLLPRSVSLPETVYLDAERLLRSEGTDYPFTARRSGGARVHVILSAHCTATATVRMGPLRTALRPDPVLEPEAEPEVVFTVTAGDGPRRVELREDGPYVLRIDPIPMAMGSEGKTSARVIVRPDAE